MLYFTIPIFLVQETIFEILPNSNFYETKNDVLTKKMKIVILHIILELLKLIIEHNPFSIEQNHFKVSSVTRCS